jgi:hypothetical protein
MRVTPENRILILHKFLVYIIEKIDKCVASNEHNFAYFSGSSDPPPGRTFYASGKFLPRKDFKCDFGRKRFL